MYSVHTKPIKYAACVIEVKFKTVQYQEKNNCHRIYVCVRVKCIVVVHGVEYCREETLFFRPIRHLV